MISLDEEQPAAAPPIVDAAIIAEAQADAGDRAAPAAGAGSQPAPAVPVARVIDYDAEAREVIEFAATLFFPLRPALASVYTPEVRERIAVAGAPLLRKYNIDLSMLGPELMFAMVVIPLIGPTIAALRQGNAPKVSNEKQQTSETPAGGAVGAQVAAESPLDRFPGLVKADEG